MLQPTARAPDEEERAVLDRRAERARVKAEAQMRSQTQQEFYPPLFGAIGATVVILLLPMGATLKAAGLALPALLAMGALIAARRLGRDREARLAEVARRHAERASRVTEYRLTVDRIVTATAGPDDRGAWWLFHLDDGTWLAFDEEQWSDDLDGATRPWHRDVKVALDASRTAVSIRSEGRFVPIERRALQPPDFQKQPDTLYWSPSGGDWRLPVVVLGDPTVTRDWSRSR